MTRAAFALLGLVCFVAPAFAASDEANQPYEYRVIVKIAKHRPLTPVFSRQLRDELQDWLQSALGPLAHVEVQDADALPKNAWLDPATLDSHAEIGAAKRHFVEVDYADGRFVVRARQLDGSTGFASPVVREARTADRAFVGRLAVRFLAQDFGPVGSVIAFDKSADRATLSLRGGAIAPHELARLVPAGSVFALTRPDRTPLRGRPIDFAYLVTMTEPRDGKCECKFVYRYQNLLDDWASNPVHAIRLGVAQGPVQIRLLDRNGLPPKDLQIRISPEGFRPSDKIRDQGALRNGVFATNQLYDRIAYAQVMSGDRRIAQIPIPIIDDRVTLCRVATAIGGEARQQLELESAYAYQRLHNIRQRLAQQRIRLEGSVREQRHQEALADVKKNIDVLDRELGALLGDLERLRRESATIESGAKPLLEQCEVFTADIRKRRESLLSWQEKLEEALKDEASQEPKKVGYLAMLRKADLQKEEADIEGAIQTYKEMLSTFGEREDVRKRLSDLESAWTIRSDEHREARLFAYGAWANVKSVDDIRTCLPKARDALEVCKKVGDKYTALKLLLASTGVAQFLIRTVDEIEKSDSEVDKINLPQLQKFNEELQELIKDIGAFIRPSEGGKP